MPEVWFPGSDKPFHPVNPHGRSVPKAKKSIREPLYQLIVMRVGRGQIPFGPKMQRQFVDSLYETVLGAIRSGVEKELSDPHVVLCV